MLVQSVSRGLLQKVPDRPPAVAILGPWLNAALKFRSGRKRIYGDEEMGMFSSKRLRSAPLKTSDVNQQIRKNGGTSKFDSVAHSQFHHNRW